MGTALDLAQSQRNGPGAPAIEFPPLKTPAVELDGQFLTLESISGGANEGWTVTLSEAAGRRMTASRGVVESVVARGETAYGINTGFGKLAEMRIPLEELAALQRN